MVFLSDHVEKMGIFSDYASWNFGPNPTEDGISMQTPTAVFNLALQIVRQKIPSAGCVVSIYTTSTVIFPLKPCAWLQLDSLISKFVLTMAVNKMKRTLFADLARVNSVRQSSYTLPGNCAT